jgi:hypothetical protein
MFNFTSPVTIRLILDALSKGEKGTKVARYWKKGINGGRYEDYFPHYISSSSYTCFS